MKRKLMKVRVYPGPFCNTEALDEDNCMHLEEGAVLAQVLKKLKYPFLLKMAGFYLVNYKRAPLDTKLKDGDVISIFAPLSGG